VNGFINIANYIVMASGSLLGGYLYEHVDPKVPFLVAAATVLPSFLLILALVREPEKREE
jgi:predicted MFS family arabinose efflux permease